MLGPGPQGTPLESWHIDTGGAVGSSPAVVDGAVFVGSVDRNVYAIAGSAGPLAVTPSITAGMTVTVIGSGAPLRGGPSSAAVVLADPAEGTSLTVLARLAMTWGAYVGRIVVGTNHNVVRRFEQIVTTTDAPYREYHDDEMLSADPASSHPSPMLPTYAHPKSLHGGVVKTGEQPNRRISTLAYK
jgi:hypothetical protein